GGEGGKILRKDESIRVSRVRAGAHQDSTTAGGAGSAGGTLRFTHPAAPPKFVRRIYEPPKLIDLLDIVAGGNGTGNHRGKGIDPSDGKMTPEYVDARCLGDGQYWPVLWHRMIDGVFMPNGRDGAVQLDSAGHSFDGFPETLGDSWGSIWARSKKVEPNQDDNAWVSQITDVERFMPDGRGVLAFCPNVGLTFDLGAIHRKYSESRPVRFQAAAGLASSDIMPPLADGLVDLWIFVDGRLALKRIGLSRKDGPINLNVDLAPTDRFLTLVATDGGDGISSDWLILGDPVIKLVPAKAEKE
ncbi:MAG: NPCBM/NEW2 domain-containing protein, partial [Pirellulales bacterium]|nr:NPCBM/NEW2 domain-containing protein [Pirellulales bacterium]